MSVYEIKPDLNAEIEPGSVLRLCSVPGGTAVLECWADGTILLSTPKGTELVEMGNASVRQLTEH